MDGGVLEARVSRLQGGLREVGVDVALILSPVNTYYLAGTAQRGVLLVPSSGEPTFYAIRDYARASTETPFKCVEARGLAPIVDALSSMGARVVGVEEDFIPVRLYRRLVGDRGSMDVSGLIMRMRMVKDQLEQGLIRRAVEQCEVALREAEEAIREGAREVEVATRLEAALREAGHDGYLDMRGPGDRMPNVVVLSSGSVVPSRLSSVSAGPGLSPACPVGSSSRRIRRGDVVWVDVSGRFMGYTADVTRTFTVGRARPEVLEAHRAVREIYREAVAMVRQGATCRSIYREALRLAEELGYAGSFMGLGRSKAPFIGHGLGLEIDEPPALGDVDEGLAEGMVLAVEPKLVLPGYEGVGLESTVIVGREGCEVLDRYTLDLVEV